jgi:hypothetical protein
MEETGARRQTNKSKRMIFILIALVSAEGIKKSQRFFIKKDGLTDFKDCW